MPSTLLPLNFAKPAIRPDLSRYISNDSERDTEVEGLDSKRVAREVHYDTDDTSVIERRFDSYLTTLTESG
jgi:hypothetical protein